MHSRTARGSSLLPLSYIAWPLPEAAAIKRKRACAGETCHAFLWYKSVAVSLLHPTPRRPGAKPKSGRSNSCAIRMAVLLRSGVGEGSEKVILQLVEADEPPAHLPVGPDAIRNIREKIGAIQAEIAAWEAVLSPTNYQ